MFSFYTSLQYVSLPNYIPLLTTVEKMFEYCENLSSINLDFLQSATKLEKIGGMFSYCTSLNEIIFPELNANYLWSTYKMFIGCTNLININLEGLKTNSIQIMISMFENCVSLKSLNIFNLNTGNVAYIASIFKGVKKGINITYNPMITDHDLRSEIEKISIGWL